MQIQVNVKIFENPLKFKYHQSQNVLLWLLYKQKKFISLWNNVSILHFIFLKWYYKIQKHLKNQLNINKKWQNGSWSIHQLPSPTPYTVLPGKLKTQILAQLQWNTISSLVRQDHWWDLGRFLNKCIFWCCKMTWKISCQSFKSMVKWLAESRHKC